MEHVGVGKDHVRGTPDLAAVFDRCVAVVDRRRYTGQAIAVERLELVLRERLRRIEVEGAALGVACERVEHGQVEGEGLPGRSAGGDDQALAAGCRVPGLTLVGVEGLDADRAAHTRIELFRNRRGALAARRLLAQVGELFGAFEQVDRECCNRHQPIVLAPLADAAARPAPRSAHGPRPTLSGGNHPLSR